MKIKIFVDAHVFDDSYQGTTTYLRGLYSALVSHNDFEITLAAQNIEGLKEKFPDPAFKFMALPSGSKLKRLAIDMPRLIKAGQFDYAHFQYITPLIKECKYINTIHDLLFMDFPAYFPFSYRLSKQLMFGFSAKRSDLVCTVSDYSKQALIRHFNIKSGSITITPNAVDVYNGAFINVKEKYRLNKYLLFVSRVEPRKNHYGLLKAFTELKLHKQGYQLVFIGRTKDVETKIYHDYFNALPAEVKEKVIHLENISYSELSSFYQQAELFVYPSVAEGFGIPPLEAAVTGCKVLCSNLTAMSDFDFFGPYLFNPHDEQEFKSKILGTLNDSNYPYAAIREAIIKKYNWQIIAADFAAKLRSAI